MKEKLEFYKKDFKKEGGELARGEALFPIVAELERISPIWRMGTKIPTDTNKFKLPVFNGVGYIAITGDMGKIIQKTVFSIETLEDMKPETKAELYEIEAKKLMEKVSRRIWEDLSEDIMTGATSEELTVESLKNLSDLQISKIDCCYVVSTETLEFMKQQKEYLFENEKHYFNSYNVYLDETMPLDIQAVFGNISKYVIIADRTQGIGFEEAINIGEGVVNLFARVRVAAVSSERKYINVIVKRVEL